MRLAGAPEHLVGEVSTLAQADRQHGVWRPGLTFDLGVLALDEDAVAVPVEERGERHLPQGQAAVAVGIALGRDTWKTEGAPPRCCRPRAPGKMAMGPPSMVVTIGLALGCQGSPETHHRRSREPQS